MLAFLFFFSFTFFENKFYKRLNKSSAKYFDIGVIFSLAAILFFVFELIHSLYFLNVDIVTRLNFSYDWRFWLFLIIETIAMFSLNQNYIFNPKDHTSINAGVFSTVIFMPVFVFICDPIFGFENTLKIPGLSSFNNVLMFSGFLLLFSFLYFYPKLKYKIINKPYLILLSSTLLLLSFYLEVKLLQTYKFNWFIYSIFELVLGLVYLSTSFFSSKEKSSNRTIRLQHFTFAFFYTVFGSILLIGSTIVSSEIGLLFRRVSQIISGVFIDDKKISTKDIMLLFIIMSAPFVLMLFN